MKAITLWQPWASLIADGRKTIETRPRPMFTNYRGLLAIHAGAQIDFAACDRFGYQSVPMRTIVAIVQVEGAARFPHPDFPPDPYGDFAAGRYGTRIKLITKVTLPGQISGKQGVWNWEPPTEWKWLLDASTFVIDIKRS